MSGCTESMIQHQFLTLITHFYCSLTGKKDMQNISTQIREFVLMRHDIKNKQQAAKRILDFLLNIQSHLISKSDQDWDRAFELSTARGYALLKICTFPMRHACSLAFERINFYERPVHTENHTIMMNIQSQEDDINIQIEEEIKKKTYFFFKWCQFVDQSKALRQFKKREVHNQKLSLSFNKYGLKSSYFNVWKTLWKKSKQERAKSKIIEDTRKKRLKQIHINIIQEVAAIVTVEQGLSLKIGEKIIQIRKREVFKKLKCNRKVIREEAGKSISKGNSYVSTFIQHLTHKIKPLMNKSFQISRSRLEHQATINLASKYFSYFKKLAIETSEQILTVCSLRKKVFLMNWKLSSKLNFNFTSQCRNLHNFISLHRKRNVVSVICLKNMLRLGQYKQIGGLVRNFGDSFNKKSLDQISIKRELEDKIALFSKIRLQKSIHNFIDALQNKKQAIEQSREYKKNTLQVILKTLMHRFSLVRIRYEQYLKYFENLRVRHSANIKASSFQRWKKLKLYRKHEQSGLEIMNRLSKNLIVKSFWKKLSHCAEEKSRQRKFISTAEQILKKIAFSKLAKKSLAINQGVRGMISNKNRKLMQNLLRLLKQNQQYNYLASLKIHTFKAKQSQKLLIKSLQQLKNEANKNHSLSLYLQKNRIRIFLNQLKQQVDRINTMNQKCKRVSKKTFLAYFRKAATADSAIKQKMIKREEVLSLRLGELARVKFVMGLKSFTQHENSIKLKKHKIIKSLLQSNLSKIKDYIKVIKKTALIQRKASQIETKRTADSIRVLMLRKKSIKLRQVLYFSKKRRTIVDSLQLNSTKTRMQLNLANFSTFLTGKMRKQFFTYLLADKKMADEKYHKLFALREEKNTQKIGLFYKLLGKQNQYLKAKEKLIETRRRVLLSQLVATSLKLKFNKIKFHTSLKFYARHILSKAFRSLKNAHVKVKQKQNMMKLDRTASIMVEKSIQKSFKSNTLSEQIEKFNLRKSRLIR